MASDQKVLVPPAESDEIDRKMLSWLNTFSEKPCEINYETLEAGTPSMALTTSQSAYITHRWILGGYEAEYLFDIVYSLPTLDPSENDRRLSADELLNRLAAWAYGQKPDIGDGLSVRRVERTNRAHYDGKLENGDEIHVLHMKMTYERMK